jgi:hypothetical protein
MLGESLDPANRQRILPLSEPSVVVEIALMRSPGSRL